MNQADVIVIGLGGMGAATAYQLSRNGSSVLGIDRYSPPHELSSSYGDTRITRQAIGEHGPYVPLVLRSNEIWRELEDRTGENIFERTGGLIMQAASCKVGQHGANDFVASTAASANFHSIEHRMLDSSEIQAEFPQFHLSEEHSGYYEPGAGFVRPEAAIRAQLRLAETHGAILNTNEQVLEIKNHTSSVTVKTDKGSYSADQLVVTAGPWIPDLPGFSAFKSITRRYRQVLYWFEIIDSFESFLPERFPVFIWIFGINGEQIYGFPAIDGPHGGLKVATEQYANEERSADDMLRDVSIEEMRQMYETRIRGLIPALGPHCVKAKACAYTTTPDFNFIIDQAPEMANVTIVSACSGHGFKHSAAVGESVAQLITTGQSDKDLSHFTLDRFE